MQEVISYLTSVEERFTEFEARIAELEAQVARLQEDNDAQAALLRELQSRPVAVAVAQPEPQAADTPATPAKVRKPRKAAPEAEPAQVVVPEPAPAPAPEPHTDEPSKAQLYGQPVDDIRKAISVGDRFLFQKELFDKNAELMQQTLDHLNLMASFDEAVTYLHTKFAWDRESQAYELFMTVLHRRLG